MGVGDGVGLRSRPRSRSSSAYAEFNSKNVVLPTLSRKSRLYACLKTGRRDEDVQKHCDLQDKKHENTVLSGEREAAASVRAAMLDRSKNRFNMNTHVQETKSHNVLLSVSLYLD